MAYPKRYAVHLLVEGELDPEWAGMLSDLSVVRGPDGTTLVQGEVPDQASLHGLLAAVRDLGLSLVSLECRVATTSLHWMKGS